MQVEDVTRVRLTTWRTTEQQRHLTVGHSLLRQVIEDDEGVASVVTEELAHGGTRVRREVLERRGVGRSSRHNRGVLERVTVLRKRWVRDTGS